MKRKQYEWLCAESEDWVARGIVTPAQAERIRACYLPSDGRSRVRLGDLTSWAGAVLIGLGVILLLAYNWDELSRPARLGVAVGLLAASQLGTLFGAARGQAGRYREAWSVLQALMVGASLALMGQTYQIGTRFDQLLLAWMALILPLAYLTNTALPALVYAAVGCFWGFAARGGASLWLGWPLAAALWPLLRRWADDPARRRTLLWSGAAYLAAFQLAWLDRFENGPERWLAWALLALLFALQRRFSKATDRALLGWLAAADALVVFAATCMRYLALDLQLLALFAVAMAAGGRWLEAEGRGALRRPLSSLGTALSLLLCFALSFRDAWSEWIARSWEAPGFAAAAASCLCFLAAALWRAQLRRRLTATEWAHACMAPLVFALLLAGARPGAAAAAINVYLFVWGALLVKRGADARRGVWLNGGLAVLSVLLLARFFDTDMSYLTRGLVFIALGAAFIAANAWLARRKGVARDEK